MKSETPTSTSRTRPSRSCSTSSTSIRWHLDERPLRADNEINPDVVGYIFEKYINQKQMGAYYTKEDITEYISKNTIIPFLFDAAEKKCPIAFKPDSFLWRLLRDDPDRYIYPAVRHGVIDDDGSVIPIPTLAEIAAGMHGSMARMQARRLEPAGPGRLRPAHRNLARSTSPAAADAWRSARSSSGRGPHDQRSDHAEPGHLAVRPRRHRQQRRPGTAPRLLARHRKGHRARPDLRLRRVPVRRPAHPRNPLQRLPGADGAVRRGPGRQAATTRETVSATSRTVLAQIAEHPNERYFILKSIIINNLFGVDIMEEAVEICKLRLFLKLVAQVETADQIEPLPDIDFNIRAGNTLVGLRVARPGPQVAGRDDSASAASEVQRIEEDAEMVERAFEQFRAQQTKHGGKVTAKDKQELRRRLAQARRRTRPLSGRRVRHCGRQLQDESRLRGGLRQVEGQPRAVPLVRGVLRHHGHGGFDVIIGNPPYVAVSKVNYLATTAKALKLPDLYAHVLLRSFHVPSASSRFGMIVPLSVTFSEDFGALRSVLTEAGNAWFSSFDNIPAALFAGVSQRCTIWMGDRSRPQVFVTPMYRWRSCTRLQLFPKISYVEATPLVKSENGIPKIATHQLCEVLARTGKVNGRFREVLANSKDAKHRLGFSPSARNFVSVFREPPPCLDDSTLRAVESSDQASLGLSDSKDISAAVIAVAGECFFHHWLTWGDGFHVTSGNIASFVRLLDRIPEQHLNLLRALGECLLARRNEALAFKRNAGKYIGNFNYRGHAWLTRRADLVLMAGLEMNEDCALELFGYVQRVLAINEFAGEKAIPDVVKSKYKPGRPDESFKRSVLDAADRLIVQHFHFAPGQLDFLLNLDVLFRAGNRDG